MKTFKLATIAAALVLATAVQSQIKIANIVELSGPGTTAGTMFKNGIDMAVKEINAQGGILGQKIELTNMDTQTNPGVAKGLTVKAIDDKVFAIFGPVYSGSILVSMAESQKAQVPNFTGGEAASITTKGNPYIFRTSFTQATAMPKVAKYIKDQVKSQNLAIVYVNNDFGKGGLDMIKKALAGSNTKIATEVSTESGQVDFSSAVLKAKQSGADALFVYTNEEESARLLRELRKQGWNKPIIGETVLTSQKVIELAGEAANGAVAHVGLTVDAPIPAIRAYRAKFERAYGTVSDHNGMKGYSGVYALKAAIEKVGKLDRVAVAKAMHTLKVSTAQEPGILMDVAFDANGDLDRESFLTEVKGGKQVVVSTLPPLNPDAFKTMAAAKPAAKAPAKK
jgi:branched-chain amino acid transport system substrate-binding protein